MTPFFPSFFVSGPSFVEAGRNPTQSKQLPQAVPVLVAYPARTSLEWVAGFAWNQWQTSSGISKSSSLELAKPDTGNVFPGLSISAEI